MAVLWFLALLLIGPREFIMKVSVWMTGRKGNERLIERPST